MMMGVYSRTKADGSVEYALVSRGTVSWSLQDSDVYNNIQQPFGLSEDMRASIRSAEEFVEEHADAQITFIGHSKGGAEAIANAVATDRHAIVFNPATPALDLYGLVFHDRRQIDAYVVLGEILSVVEGAAYLHYVDTPHFLPSVLDANDYYDSEEVESAWWMFRSLVAVKEKAEALLDWSLDNHSMENVIESLKAAGYR